MTSINLRRIRFLAAMSVMLPFSLAAPVGGRTLMADGASAALSPRLTVLFQKYRHNWPTDSFFAAQFDPNRGRVSEPHSVPPDEAWRLAVTRQYDGRVASGFALPDQTGPYELLYERSKEDESGYRQVILRRSDQKLMWTLQGATKAQVQGEKLLYIEVHTPEPELRERDLESGTERVLAVDVTAFAGVDRGTIWLFFADGRVVRRQGKNDFLVRRLGLYVAGAGPIAPGWLWFYARPNTKWPGHMWILDTRQERMHKIPSDWEQGRLMLVKPATP